MNVKNETKRYENSFDVVLDFNQRYNTTDIDCGTQKIELCEYKFTSM